MAVTRRRKLAIISLAIYWPALFVSSHMPVPKGVEGADISDKTLHLLAYAILVFLLWVVLNPDRKVRWRKAAVWWVLLIVAAYGVIDELLQPYWGRNCDVKDWVADMAGSLTVCFILTFFTFWPAAVILVAVLICGLTNIAQEGLAEIAPVANAMFHLFSYAVFTLVWIRCTARPQVRQFDTLRAFKLEPKWLMTALGPPIVLLVAAKAYSIALGRGFPMHDVILSVGGIVGAVGIWTAVLFHRSANQGSERPDA